MIGRDQNFSGVVHGYDSRKAYGYLVAVRSGPSFKQNKALQLTVIQCSKSTSQ